MISISIPPQFQTAFGLVPVAHALHAAAGVRDALAVARDGVDGQLGIEDLPPVQRIAVHGDGHGDGQLMRDDAHVEAADGRLRRMVLTGM